MNQRNLTLLAVICVVVLVSPETGQAQPSEVESDRPSAGLPPLALQRLPVNTDKPDGSVAQIALSHNGRLLAVRRVDHSIQIWNLPTRKLVWTWHDPDRTVFDLCFSLDDRLVQVATGNDGPGIHIWDVATGKTRGEITFPAFKLAAATESTVWAVGMRGAVELGIGPSPAGREARFDRDVMPLLIDAKTKVVVGYERYAGNAGELYKLRLFRFSGQSDDQFDWANPHYWGSRGQRPLDLVSVAARPIAACMVPRFHGDTVAYAITDRRRISMQRISGGFAVSWDAKSVPTCLTASRDCRFIAAGGEDGHVRIWEILTGGYVGEFPGTGGKVVSIQFAHDAGLLAAGYDDSRGVLVWDVRALLSGGKRQPPATALSPAQFQTAWEQLADGDPRKAVDGIGQLIAFPETAIRMVADEIDEAIVVPAADEVERLVHQLRDANYGMRTDAYERLIDLRDIIRSELEQELASGHPAEVQLQLKRILAERDTQQAANSASARQAIRALWFLELLGNEAALAEIQRLEAGHRSAEVRGTAKRIRQARFGER